MSLESGIRPTGALLRIAVGSTMAAMLGNAPAVAQDNGTVPAPAHPPVHHPVQHHAPAHHPHGVTAKSAEHPATTASISAGTGQGKEATPPPSAGHSTATAKAEPPAATESAPASPLPGGAAAPSHTAAAAPSHTAATPSAKTGAAPAETAASAVNPKSPMNPAIAESFVGQAVYGRKGEKIGDLSQVVTGPDGKVKSAVITWGGMFGYFQSSRTVDWATANPVVKDGKLVLDKMTKDQLRKDEQPQASR